MGRVIKRIGNVFQHLLRRKPRVPKVPPITGPAKGRQIGPKKAPRTSEKKGPNETGQRFDTRR